MSCTDAATLGIHCRPNLCPLGFLAASSIESLSGSFFVCNWPFNYLFTVHFNRWLLP